MRGLQLCELTEFGEDDRGLAYRSRWIAENLQYRQPVLLWITEWGIWSGSENWHLYHLHGLQRFLNWYSTA
jgi:hypothetical protein